MTDWEIAMLIGNGAIFGAICMVVFVLTLGVW